MFLLFHAVKEHGTERHGIAIHLPGLQTAGIVALGVILDRHGTIAVLQQHEIEQLAAGPPVAVHERVDVLEHRMEAGGPEQRMSAARVQPVDQGPQVVADLQRVGGLDAGRGDPRQITVGAERAAGERLEVQRRHLMDAPDQFLIQSPPLPGVFAHVGHAVRDAARGEHVPCRRIRRDELALQNQGRVLQGQRGSLYGV